MKDSVILNKVILLAEERGFQGRVDTLHYDKPNSTDLAYGRNMELCEAAIALNTYQGIIFSHDFAKAFWGEKNMCTGCLNKATEISTGEEMASECCHEPMMFNWQNHLQNMVIKPDPIKYLTRFL